LDWRRLLLGRTPRLGGEMRELLRQLLGKSCNRLEGCFDV